MADIYVSDNLTLIRVGMAIDLTLAESAKMLVYFKGVGDSEYTEVGIWDAAIETPGTTGVVSATKTSDRLNELGTYKIHARAFFPGGGQWTSKPITINTFKVGVY